MEAPRDASATSRKKTERPQIGYCCCCLCHGSKRMDVHVHSPPQCTSPQRTNSWYGTHNVHTILLDLRHRDRHDLLLRAILKALLWSELHNVHDILIDLRNKDSRGLFRDFACTIFSMMRGPARSTICSTRSCQKICTTSTISSLIRNTWKSTTCSATRSWLRGRGPS